MKLKDEIQAVKDMTKNIENEVIRQRVEQLLVWDVKKATCYKRAYYLMSIVIIIANASIPIINQMWTGPNGRLTVSSISGLAGVIASILTLVNVKDTWFRYRKFAELMKTECILFINKCNPYNGENRECLFVNKIELIVSGERGLWEDKFKEGKDKEFNNNMEQEK
ncbi:DUF4231 domain-containing protein [Tepidibacter sp. Z1-5]|uniref:DUF4231 domain-containing protein n=1 Tax=Tepidibacter sp. Z1-5 TaxID=3134138 RepID=UPI0030BC4D01